MERSGFPGYWTSDGGYQFNYSDDQTDVFRKAFDSCLDSTGLGEKPVWTVEQWRAQYDALLVSAVCLRAEGYEIPQAPSFDLYVENPSWSPYKSIAPSEGSTDVDEFRRLLEVCPEP